MSRKERLEGIFNSDYLRFFFLLYYTFLFFPNYLQQAYNWGKGGIYFIKNTNLM